jgi:hypothetical protein
MKLCKDCKYYVPRNYESMLYGWVRAATRLPKITYVDHCGHPDYRSLVDGSPKYSCEERRTSAHRCSRSGVDFEKKQED